MDTERIFTLTVDYGKGLSELISEGKYDWVDKSLYSIITPLTLEEAVRKSLLIKLFFYSAKSQMQKQGYHHANAIEQATFGIAYPEIQSKIKIVALGSAWKKSQDVPCLQSFAYKRWYTACCLEDLKKDYYFLGVKEI